MISWLCSRNETRYPLKMQQVENVFSLSFISFHVLSLSLSPILSYPLRPSKPYLFRSFIHSFIRWRLNFINYSWVLIEKLCDWEVKYLLVSKEISIISWFSRMKLNRKFNYLMVLENLKASGLLIKGKELWNSTRRDFIANAIRRLLLNNFQGAGKVKRKILTKTIKDTIGNEEKRESLGAQDQTKGKKGKKGVRKKIRKNFMRENRFKLIGQKRANAMNTNFSAPTRHFTLLLILFYLLNEFCICKNHFTKS